MSRLSMVVGAVLLLAVGFVAGMVVGGNASRSGSTPEHEAAGSSAAADGASATLPSAPARTAPDAAEPVRRERSRAPIDPDPRPPAQGNGVVHCSVRTESGDPLPGVRIVLEALSSSMPGYTRVPATRDLDLDAEEIIDSFAAITRWRHRSRVERTTDALGEAEFAGLPALEYRAIPVLDGYRIRREDGREPIVAGTRAEFEAQPIVALELDVRLPDGTQPERAQVAFRHGNSHHNRQWTPDGEPLSVDPGRYDLEVTSGDHRGTAEVEVVEGVRPDPMRVELEARTGLRVTVRREGEPSPDTIVCFVARIPEGATIQPSLFADTNHHHWLHFERGASFTRYELAPGEYAVGCAFQWGHPPTIVATTRATVTEGVAEAELLLPRLDETLCLLVRVTDSDAQPLDGAEFRILVRHLGGSSSSGVNPLHVDDGVHYLSRPTGGADEVVLTVSHEDYGSVVRPIDPSARGVLDVAMAEPALLTLRVPGLGAGEYVGRVRAAIELATEAPTHGLRDTGLSPDQVVDDAFPEQRLAPGRYVVRLYVQGSRFSRMAVAERTVDLTSGERMVTLPMPALYSVRVHASPELGGRRVQLYARTKHDGDSETWTSGAGGILSEQGECVVDGLPAGTYRVSLSGSSESRTITLPGDTEVRF